MRAVVVPMEHTLRPIGYAEDAAYDLEHYAQEICAMQWPDRHRSEAEVYANARLIAAAPDYDAAAQEAIAAIEALTGTIPQDQLDALMNAYGSLRRARAKARGK